MTDTKSFTYPDYSDRSAAANLDCSTDKDWTVQGPKDECDINVMMKRFGLTGQMPRPQALPYYGDFTAVDDYQGAIEAVREAQDHFMTLPAELRARFENNPADLITWLEDPANKKEAQQLGLLSTPPEATGTDNPVT